MMTALVRERESAQRRKFWVGSFWRIAGGGAAGGTVFGASLILVPAMGSSGFQFGYLLMIAMIAALFGAFVGLVVGLGAATVVTVVVYAFPRFDRSALTIGAAIGGAIGAIPGAVLAVALTNFLWVWIGPTVPVLAALGSAAVTYLRLRTVERSGSAPP